jgi:hypothetical protein
MAPEILISVFTNIYKNIRLKVWIQKFIPYTLKLKITLSKVESWAKEPKKQGH